MRFTRAAALVAWFWAASLACSADSPAPPAAAAALPAPAAKPNGCLPSGNGFLRARIRGALNLDIDWHNAELECEGEVRPNGNGIRLSFAGPLRSDGRRLRMVFGVANAAEGNAGSALPTNLTVIFEGEKRLFATRGDDRCTVDKLDQERLGALGGPTRTYRVVARGFCIAPVTAVSGDERIVVSSFDFAGHVTFGTAPESTQKPTASSNPAPEPSR